MSEQQERAIVTADRLSAALGEVGGEVASLRADMETDRAASEDRDAKQAKYSRMTRIYLLIAAIGLLFDITGTTLAVVAIVKVSHNSATIGDIHQSNLQGCEANNLRLARQEASIDAILQPPAHVIPAEKAATDAYFAAARAKIAVAWQPRNCLVAYSLKGH